ncbi:hypothetical protein D3C80_1582070 [compost metagenome]
MDHSVCIDPQQLLGRPENRLQKLQQTQQHRQPNAGNDPYQQHAQESKQRQIERGAIAFAQPENAAHIQQRPRGVNQHHAKYRDGDKLQRLAKKCHYQSDRQRGNHRDQLAFAAVGIVNGGTGVGTADGESLRKPGDDIHQPQRTKLAIGVNFVAIFCRKAPGGQHHADKADDGQVERRDHQIAQQPGFKIRP